MPSTAGSSGMGQMYLPTDYSMPASLYSVNAYDTRPSTAPSLGMGTGARETSQPTPEMLARYRAQAELLSRAGVVPNGAITSMSTASSVMPGMYAEDNSALDRYGLPTQAPAWGHAEGHPYGGTSSKDLQDYAHDGRSFQMGGGSAALSAHPPTHAAPFPGLSSASGHASSSGAHAASAAYGSGIPFPQHHSGQGHSSSHQRRSEELSDDYGSDSGVSVPSSANSSSVHLPLGDHTHRRHYTDDSNSPTIPYHQSGRKDDGVGEGGFSSAFGLMSLDDPNVLAGLANDSAPFFSALQGTFAHDNDAHSANSSSTSLHSEVSNDASSQTSLTSQSSVGSSGGMGLSLPTPTPELIASLKSGGLLSAGGREALDSKELREFWKQYMRTPLTGPGANTPLFPLQTPTGPGQQLGVGMAGSSTGAGAGRPSPSRRHSRVASLPSMKTPPILGNGSMQEFNTFAPPGNFSLSLGPKARERQQHHGEHMSHLPQVSFSNVRTTLHGDAEDLKSYEQAVLARKAPTTLNLVPRRRGTLPAGSMAPTSNKNLNMSPPQLPAISSIGAGSLSQATNLNAGGSLGQGQPGGQSSNNSKIGDLLNHERPGSSSSLADAFGSPYHQRHQQHLEQHEHQYPAHDHYRMQHTHSSESPRESSVGAESDSGASTSFRPSFKRLASQTLGPPNTKRALLGPAGWDDVQREGSEGLEEDEDVDEDEKSSRRFAGRAYGQGGGHPARRFSLPAAPSDGGGSVTLPPLRTAVGQVHDSQSQSPVANAYP